MGRQPLTEALLHLPSEPLFGQHLDPGPLEAQVLVADWRNDYNTYRPHSALGMLTPAEYADRWANNNPKKLS